MSLNAASAISGQLEQLERRTQNQRNNLLERLADAKAQGRRDMNTDEIRALRDIEALENRCADLREEAARAGDFSALSQRVNASGNTMTAARHIDDRDLTYRAGDRRTSWVRDLTRHSLNRDDDGSSYRRLQEHARQVADHHAYAEFRDLSRVDGQGGYAVPPAWLMNQYVELARPGRAFANLVQRQPLPGGTDSINVPKVLSGTAVGIQNGDNTSVTDVDLTDTFISCPVRTIAGQEGVAIQLIDQSPIAFDDVVFRDLIAAHAAATDQQVLYGTGSNGQVLGVDYTSGVNTVAVGSVTIQGVYSAIANAIQTVHTTRFLPPTAIVMHPRRWGWFLSLLDSTDRPLILPYASNPMNAVGILSEVDSQQIVGQLAGLPVITDPNVTTTAGSESGGGTEDIIYVLRAQDLILYESGIRARVMPEVKASTLTVLLQVYSYLAFTAARYPQSIVTVTGLPTPTF
ncbi:phage major capsid protein [Mycobacterium sp. SA01]|uniref:phage major capsid protein n=1 Tax=Mycobacterium sp. SA01 TaxID=3238820 RepID=UPI00351B7C13